jgi:hypothetical protein
MYTFRATPRPVDNFEPKFDRIYVIVTIFSTVTNPIRAELEAGSGIYFATNTPTGAPSDQEVIVQRLWPDWKPSHRTTNSLSMSREFQANRAPIPAAHTHKAQPR